MATALINPEMLTWARNRSRLSLAVLAKKLGVPEQKLAQWEAGEKTITFAQAKSFADKTYVPFGYLFLPEPPAEKLTLPDLRTIGGEHPQEPSAELLDIVKITTQRQEWFKEYLQDQFIDKNPVVGQFSVDDTIAEIVASMRRELGILPGDIRGTKDDYYRKLVSRIEDLGIMVMREGFIKHHTRPLNVEEFRGFAIADELAPVIFVNHADAPAPRLFTLIHELCHIWIGQSGVSDASPQNHRKEEVLCNAVAGEFLVPEREFFNLWDDGVENFDALLEQLATSFHVSTWVIARRALTFNKITNAQYNAHIQRKRDAYARREKQGGGPSYYRSKNAQISKQFSKAVVLEALSGHILLRDAGRLLSIKPSKVKNFARELGV